MKIVFAILRCFAAFLIFWIAATVALYFALPKLGFALVRTDPSGNVPVISSLALSGDVHDSGINADRVLLENPKRATVYVRFSRRVDEDLILKVFDRAGLEIARSRKNVKGETDDAENVEFEFPDSMPLAHACSFQLAVGVRVPAPVNEDVSEEENTGTPPADEKTPETNVPAAQEIGNAEV